MKLILNGLLALAVGLGWVWQKAMLLILMNFLALGVALGFVDSKGLIGFV